AQKNVPRPPLVRQPPRRHGKKEVENRGEECIQRYGAGRRMSPILQQQVYEPVANGSDTEYSGRNHENPKSSLPQQSEGKLQGSGLRSPSSRSGWFVN